MSEQEPGNNMRRRRGTPPPVTPGAPVGRAGHSDDPGRRPVTPQHPPAPSGHPQAGEARRGPNRVAQPTLPPDAPLPPARPDATRRAARRPAPLPPVPRSPAPAPGATRRDDRRAAEPEDRSATRTRRPAPDPQHLAWSQTPTESPRPDSTVGRGSAAAAAAGGGYAPRQEPQPLTGYAPRAGRPGPGDADAQRRAQRSARPAQRPRTESGSGGDRHRRGLRRRPARSSSKPRRKRHIGRIALIVVVAVVAAMIAAVFYYDSKLNRVDALASYAGRPGNTPGTTWLIVGSDSRSDLSQEQKDRLATGDSDGSRTDTIMLIHKPPSGSSMIISIPRDLYVNIPDYGMHKVNAAFSLGGPQLLVRTVEELSGVRIDHYGEIGFGGFDTLVDAVGGVEMCLDQALNDPKAGLRLPAGCQNLNGEQALGLVRTRAFPNADLERVVNQRKFLSALMSKATSPGVLLNPFRLIPFVNGAVDSLTVDNGDHIWNLIGLAFALRGDPITTTTPIGGNEYTADGDALIVGDNTTQFFDYLRKGQTVPDDLLSTGGGAVG